MKKFSVIVISVLLSIFSATAQNIDDFFAQQKAKDSVEYSKLPNEAIRAMNLVSKIASLASSFSDDIPKEDSKIISLCSNILDDVDDLEFVISKNDKVNLQQEFKKLKIDKSRKYKFLGKKTDKTQEITVYGKKAKNKTLENMIVLIADKKNKSTIIANLKGKIKLEKVAEIIELAYEKSQNEK